MSSDVAIRIEGLGKSYRIRHEERHVTLAEQMLQRVRHPLRRPPVEEFWALRDVDLEVRRGEVLGLIGRNGAGKSTLLKILSRITAPTTGRVELFGRVSSLLEVGTGFHPELTGRENIYLNGSILGMRRREIDRQFDAIVDFAGVEKFLDTPVKRYSSGMYVRLAFAVAAHLETEILLVDEVLAVGDQEFQRRCLGKIDEVAQAGRTVILVSHNVNAIGRFATHAIQLADGRIRLDGTPDSVISAYLAPIVEPATSYRSRRPGTSERRAWIASARLLDPFAEPSSPIDLDVEIRASHEYEAAELFVTVDIAPRDGQRALMLDTRMLSEPIRDGRYRFRLISPWLTPGDYLVDIHLCTIGEIMDKVVGELRLHVSPNLPYTGFVPPGVLESSALPHFTVTAAQSASDGTQLHALPVAQDLP